MTVDRSSSRTEQLQIVSGGAGWHVLGRGIKTLLELLLNLLLANVLLAGLYGVFTYTQTLLIVFRTAASHGSDTALSRFVPSFPPGDPRRGRVVGLALASGAVFGIAGAVALFVFAGRINDLTLDTPVFEDALRVVAVAVPFEVLIVVVNSGFISVERIRHRTLVDDAVYPVLRLVATLVAVALGFSLLGMLAALAVGAVLVAAFAVRLFLRATDIAPRLTASAELAREYYGFALPTGVTNLGGFLYNRADVLIVGIFLSPTAVAIYGVALLLSKGLSLPHSGFRQLFTPLAARLNTGDNREDLQFVYRVTVRWAFTSAAFLAVALLVYRVEVLGLFGEQFTRGSAVLAVAVFGQFVRAGVGPSGNLLQVTDHQYFVLVVEWGLGIANVILDVYLVTRIGLIGPALASAGVLVVLNLTYIGGLYYFEGLRPYDRRITKPVIAAAAAGGVMVVLAPYLPGLWFFLGILAGSATMAGLIVALGIEDADKRVFATMVDTR